MILALIPALYARGLQGGGADDPVLFQQVGQQGQQSLCLEIRIAGGAKEGHFAPPYDLDPSNLMR